MDKKNLLERIKQNDALAFRDIFNMYVKKVYQFVYGYIKNREEAEDMTQAIFQRIWENRHLLNVNKSFDSYLFTIAYHVTMDHFRQLSSKKHIDTVAISQDIFIASDFTADYLINKHQFESLYQKGLDSLTDKRKEIFLLSRHDGLSNKEIAQKLNISIKTVENQMTASLSLLKDFLKKTEIPLLIFFLLKYF